MFDPNKIKNDFPIFKRKINGNDLVYLDNAATSQKPKQVVDAVSDYYLSHNANVHRGVHTLSEEATNMYEDARQKVADFIGAKFGEIVFTTGSTGSLNRVAFGWGFENLTEKDTIVFVEVDHHSNIVPWQIVSERTGAKLKSIGVTINGEIDLKELDALLDSSVKILAVSHASNVLGTIFPIAEICKIAKKYGTLVSVDGAQGIPHFKIDVKKLGCDFYSFSGHKMLGPMGIGVLWAKKELLEKMTPCEYGGGMIKQVHLDKSTWASIPQRFEAGTPGVAGAVGLASAIDYLENLGMDNIVEHEKELTKYALEELSKLEGVHILGPKDPSKRTALFSMVFDGMHPHDVATILNLEGIAVRSGQHCAMPLHESLDISSSTRASFYVYNTKDDVDALVKGIKKAKEVLL